MQEHNPHLQEHVVVLEELQYSESDESDEDFDEGEAEELNIPIRASSKTRISTTTKSEKRGGQGGRRRRRRRRNYLTVYLLPAELEKNCKIIIVSLNARFCFKNT